MEKIVNPDGLICLGIFDTPGDEINGRDDAVISIHGAEDHFARW